MSVDVSPFERAMFYKLTHKNFYIARFRRVWTSMYNSCMNLLLKLAFLYSRNFSASDGHSEMVELLGNGSSSSHRTFEG